MELSDVQPPNPLGHDQERWRFLTRDCPEEPGPDRWEQDRDRGYLDFGRGFMGFEIIRSIVSDLRSSRVRLGCLELAWRGEPLLHPEILPILRFLGVEIRDHRLTDSLRIQTDGRVFDSGFDPRAGWNTYDMGVGRGQRKGRGIGFVAQIPTRHSFVSGDDAGV